MAPVVLAHCFSSAYSETDVQQAKRQQVDFIWEKQCIAKLDLPPGYDNLKPPENMSDLPLKINIEMDIREVKEVDKSKKSYMLEVFFYIHWIDERLIGQTERTNCNPVFPAHVTPEFWIPGDI